MEICSDGEKQFEEENPSMEQIYSLTDFCIGDVLNYGRVLENGQQTQVRICMHMRTKIFFCLKLEPFTNGDHKESILKRSRLHQMSIHSSIVRLDDKFVYHVMEYLPGGDLFEMVSTIGALPVNVTKRYIVQLILATEFLHNHHILHNDIKLENLLLDSVDTVKLTDFGLATDNLDGRSLTINGTPEYMSPEIILRTSHSEAADWWSVGICLF